MPPYQPPQSPYQQPQMPAPQKPAGDQPPGQYDFIMQSGNNSTPPGFNANGQPNKLIIIGAAAIALIILVVLGFLMFGGGESNPQLSKIVRQQSEMTRVANTYGEDLTGETARALAVNTALSMSTTQADFTAYLGENGISVSSEPTAASAQASSQADQRIATAQSNGTLDDGLIEVLTQDLKDYRASLNQAYSTAETVDAQARLKTLYDQAGLLLKQATQ